MKAHCFTIPDLPSEPLWKVPVKPAAGYRDGLFRIRAPDAEKAAQRARTLMGLQPTGPAERVQEDADE